MNQAEFLSIFEKYLIVGQPRRSEILAELKNHIDELGETGGIERLLGEPSRLAERYNRTHVGVLSTPWLILSIPILAVGLITGLKILFNVGSMPPFMELTNSNLLFQIASMIIWLLPYLSAIWLGWTVTRLNRPARWALGLLGTSLIAGTVFGVLYNYTNLADWETPQTFL